MSNNSVSDCTDNPTCSDFQKIDDESLNYCSSEEDFPIVEDILEYNELFEKLEFNTIKNEGKKENFAEDLLSGVNIINSKSEQKPNISNNENDINTCIQNKSQKPINEKIKELEKNNNISTDNQPKQNELDKKENNIVNVQNENSEGGKIKDKKIKMKKKIKIKKNVIRHKGKKKKLFVEDKKNKFISLKVFNPKGDSDECKKIREEVNKTITENKAASEIIEKKPLEKKKIFRIISGENIENAKVGKKRKEKPDNIRKKVKQKFLKSLKNRINIKLKLAKSEMLFDFFPQVFIANINKKRNKKIINKKLIELFNTNFFDEYKNKNFIKDKDKEKYLEEKQINDKKYDHNLKVIEYLEENENIKKKINFDYIKEMTFGNLFNEYLESREFEKDILKLKQKENPGYIKNFINYAYTFVEYFSE